jgi:Trk K+ transport system NAD-binding subunit
VGALNTDADNLYMTLSGRALRPDLFIIARARTDSSEAKLMRAGAERVVNPQRIVLSAWRPSLSSHTSPSSSTSLCTMAASSFA